MTYRAGDFIRGYLSASGIAQKALAAHMATDPATITRRIDRAIGIDEFELGVEVGKLIARNAHQQTQRLGEA